MSRGDIELRNEDANNLVAVLRVASSESLEEALDNVAPGPLADAIETIWNQDPDKGGKDEMRKVKFEVYGLEMVEKVVGRGGKSGRIYLPPDWIGEKVKIIRGW